MNFTREALAKLGEGITEGPWETLEHSWAETSICAIDDGQRVTIARLSIEHEATEDTQEAWEAVMAANARLIEAAPKLLADLQAAHELIEQARGALERCRNFLANHQESLGIEIGSMDEMESSVLCRTILKEIDDAKA